MISISTRLANNQDTRNIELKDHHWSRILREIERGDVVPVVGPELLEITHQGKQVPFYERVAEILVERLGIDTGELAPPWSLCELVYLHRQQTGDPFETDLHHLVFDIVSEEGWQIPTAIEKLAEITDFDLFVSTTPDSFLSRALEERRGLSPTDLRTIAFAPGTQPSDLPDTYETKKDSFTTVFKLFGDASMAPDFALTEEDILRYIHHLQIRDERPVNLFDVLKKKSLAMLGCSFENWIIRFLLCSVKGENLFTSHGARGIIADKSTQANSQLLPFLNRNRTLLFPNGDAAHFVDELHRRWLESQKGKKQNNDTRSQTSEQQSDEDETEDFVFLSYAREDQAIAAKIRDQLKANNIPVWMDEQRLESGEVFETVITERIHECAFFLPIISKSTLNLERRFFRLEWNVAIAESRKWPDSYPFIQPIIVDQSSIESSEIPHEMRRRHCPRCLNGELEPDFFKNLLRTLRRYQKRAAAI